MIDMFKKVLRGVSSDKYLFRKELIKARNWLKRDEALLLKAWALATFTGVHKDLIIEVFEKIN
jgi:type IV secretory pathway TrbF-like protein